MAVVLFLGLSAELLAAANKPNVIMILTDNHGPWTLGCYGSQEIRTPNIDRLATEGTLFEQAYANNAVCSPTRATLMTGLMPSQHGVHRYLGAGGAQVGPAAYCTIAEFKTLPKIFKQAGYVCGLSGKWHLGGNLAPQEGFEYWITKPHGHSPGFYGQEVIENGAIRTEAGYLTDLWTSHGVKFIEQNQQHPFFLLLSYNGPYGLAAAMHEPIRNRHRESYESNEQMPSFPRETPSPWLHTQLNNINNLTAMRKYAAEVSAVDDGVGTIMDTLRRLQIDDNTLVVFVADQGLAGGHSGLWGMGDHTRPLTAYDPTMWIPLIFWQPGKISAGSRLDYLVSNYDIFPSLLQHLGLAAEAPDRPQLPGRNFSPALRGEPLHWDNVVFFEFENVRAIRTKQWKYIERIHQEPNELYDLQADPGERQNLIDDPKKQLIRDELKQRLHAFFLQYATPKWDLWRGGTSKSGLITTKLFQDANPQALLPVREGLPQR
jgi:arylsulfatase A-like enzyme